MTPEQKKIWDLVQEAEWRLASFDSQPRSVGQMVAWQSSVARREIVAAIAAHRASLLATGTGVVRPVLIWSYTGPDEGYDIIPGLGIGNDSSDLILVNSYYKMKDGSERDSDSVVLDTPENREKLKELESALEATYETYKAAVAKLQENFINAARAEIEAL